MKQLLLCTAALFALTTSAFAAAPATGITNEADFRAAMAGPGSLSLMESELAEKKATNADVKEFATFETEEQSTLATILKELDTPMPEMTEEDKATMEKLKNAQAGAAFDRAYVQAQVEGHHKLKGITDSYLSNSTANTTEPKEMEARHIAMLARATIKQHIANTGKLAKMVK